MTSRATFRRWATAALICATAAAIELTAGLGLRVLARRGITYRPIAAGALSAAHRRVLEDLLAGRPSLFRLDATLGWSLRPGFRSDLCRIDALGLRRDAARPQPVGGRVHIAAFGDSFTFGGDVADRFAYPEFLARLDPGLEVSNFGVPAYGLDQAFLRYQKEGRQGPPGIVVIGFMSENIFRTVSVFRPFYQPETLVPLAKPRYLLRGGELELVENPLPRPADVRRLLAEPARLLPVLGHDDAFYRARPHAALVDRSAAVRLARLARQQLAPSEDVVLRDGSYNPNGEAFAVTTAILAAFYDQVRRDGGQPVILIFPEQGDLLRFRRDGTKRYQPLLRVLAARGYRGVDAMDALEGAAHDRPVAELIPSHFSPAANELVAAQLLRELRGFGLIP